MVQTASGYESHAASTFGVSGPGWAGLNGAILANDPRALSKAAREVEPSTQKKKMARQSRIDEVLGGVVNADCHDQDS
jgi:hypothetical protein